MSRIYFHSEDDTAEILGSERAWLGRLSDDVGMSVLEAHNLREMSKWLTVDLFGRSPDEIRLNSELADVARLAVRHEDTSARALTYQGLGLSAWDITLNTALRLGSRPVQLATRIHAQCEIHGWVDGPNRGWLAEVIDEGLASRVLRGGNGNGRDPGWGKLNEFLRAASGPVVMSYSVTDQFPNASASNWEPPADYDGEPHDAWYDLSAEDRWRLSMDTLRADADRGLELKPDDWNGYVFGHNGLTWMDIIEGEARLREVLDLEYREYETVFGWDQDRPLTEAEQEDVG